jgi:hypothetical protein
MVEQTLKNTSCILPLLLRVRVALVLWGVVLFSACLAFYQDGQTEEAMGSFKVCGHE